MATKGKKKIGRPATGHEPTITIRVRQHWKDWVTEFHRYAQSDKYPRRFTESDIWREAILIGMESIKEGKKAGEFIPYGARPRHFAEIHEAGHVVAAFLVAQEEGRDPSSYVKTVHLRRGRGLVVLGRRPILPEHDFLIDLAGCAADAYDEGRTFDELWAEYKKGYGDKKAASRFIREHSLDDASEWYEDASDWLYKRFTRKEIWSGLKAVARSLKVHEAVDGTYCWDVYSAELKRAQREKRRGRKPASINWRIKGED